MAASQITGAAEAAPTEVVRRATVLRTTLIVVGMANLEAVTDAAADSVLVAGLGRLPVTR